MEWEAACIVPVYKGKGDRRDCANYRGIIILSIPRKIYGMVLISKVIESTKNQVAEEQGGFRSGRGCIDQIFILKQLVEKYRDKRKVLHVAFMDLEKTCKCTFSLSRREEAGNPCHRISHLVFLDANVIRHPTNFYSFLSGMKFS